VFVLFDNLDFAEKKHADGILPRDYPDRFIGGAKEQYRTHTSLDAARGVFDTLNSVGEGHTHGGAG